MRALPRLLLAWVIVALLLLPALPAPVGHASPAAQYDPARQRAVEMLARMSPEERVGQLFVVTFKGAEVQDKSQIYDLIVNNHVGGVVLLRANNNFVNSDDVRLQAYALLSRLQQVEWDASQVEVTGPVPGSPFIPQYIPLFTGISQEGNGYPYDQILSGVTTLPSWMSIGATWDVSLAEKAGYIMGEEMSALGFNLYLGPSLDVLYDTPAANESYIGVRSFGGDPYWVSRMGQAYITGLHEGSSSRLAVIARNFPGGGSSDRSPEDEIATVRKSLEQLKQIDLAPFFAVSGGAPSINAITDGLLVSHIRYQGFQSNIRATTRPVSLDSAALELILKQPALENWRLNGGLMVSDDLGSPALRRFYETNGVFDPLQAAREAFYAGNDVLYLNNFAGPNDQDVYTTVVRTVQFFAQKYRTDPEFARRVDASVERILTLKYRMYPTFDINQVVPSDQNLSLIGQNAEAETVIRDIARQSITLISPGAGELPNVLPNPPSPREHILFLTDVQPGYQCTTCTGGAVLGLDSMQRAVLNLYGSQATGQVTNSMMASYSFGDVLAMLADAEGDHPLRDEIQLANWVVVSILRPDAQLPESLAFKRLLSEQPRMLADKKVVVFAFDAPYYLDATDISKITAYYGLYSQTSAFADIAARVLFQEINPAGALPVSVPGTGYELMQATSPDPDQSIPLSIDSPQVLGTVTPTVESTLDLTPSLQTYGLKDTIFLRTGVIYDRNRRPVPDDTPVNFIITVTTPDGAFTSQMNQVTTDGVARISYRIDQEGMINIYALAGGARSDTVQLNISPGVEAAPTFVALPTQSPVPPTETPTPTVTVTVTPTLTPTVTPTPPPPPVVEVRDWFFMAVLVTGATAGVSCLGIRREIARWGLRWALCGLIGGLLAYNYLALRLPGTESLLNDMGTGGILMVTFLGVSAGWLVGLVWKQLSAKGGPFNQAAADKNPTGERKSSTGPRS